MPKKKVHSVYGKNWDYINVQCLNFIPGITGCPHFHGEDRVQSFLDMMKNDYSICVGLGVDDGVAIQIKGNHFRIRRNDDHQGNAYLIRRCGGDLEMRALEIKEEYEPLDILHSWISYKFLSQLLKSLLLTADFVDGFTCFEKTFNLKHGKNCLTGLLL